MTDAEQVVCDALRSAGLDEVADNLAFAREAVRQRRVLMEALEHNCDCGQGGRFGAHNLDCATRPLLATQPGWLEAEYVAGYEAALDVQRYQRRLAEQLDPMAAMTGLSDVVRGYNRTVAGRLDQAAELIRAGTITPEDYLRVVSGDRAVIVDQPTAVVKPSEHGHE